jgi:competence protein CoiA
MGNRHLLKEAEEVGCYGLIEGWANNQRSHKKFYAPTSSKEDGPFYCSQCYSDAVIRKCTEKKDHFAHKARLSPVITKKDDQLHQQCRDEICKLLIEKFPNGKWATERTIPENKSLGVPVLRPDLSGRINNIRVVIEVQASSLTLPKLIQRAKAYSKRKIAVLWIVPLIEPLGNDPFRPRLYERYLHSMYYGRIYYWISGQGLQLTPVHFGTAERWIEYSEWYDENGDYQEVGGFYKPYKVVKTPIYGNRIDISADFYQYYRPSFTPENEGKAVPALFVWRDSKKLWWVPKD